MSEGETYNGTFSLRLDGTPIKLPTDDGEPRILAQAEASPELAVFSLENGLLQAGDWYLGRGLIEDRSLLPKRLFWHKKAEVDGEHVHRTVLKELGGGEVELKNGGAPLALHDGHIFADLMGENPARVTIGN